MGRGEGIADRGALIFAGRVGEMGGRRILVRLFAFCVDRGPRTTVLKK